MFSYYCVAIPVGMSFTFKHKKGVEGLQVGILVGQLVVTSLYSVLLDCMTNWQNVADQNADRLFKANSALLRRLPTTQTNLNL